MNSRSFSRIVCCLAVLGPLAVSCSDGTPSHSGGSGGAQSGGNTGKTGTGGTSAPGGSGGSLPGSGGKGTGGESASGGAPGTGGKGSGGAPGSGGTAPGTGGKGSGGASSATGGNASGGALGSGGTASGSGGRATGGTIGAGGSAPIDAGTAGSAGLAGPAVPSDGCGKATTAKTGDNQSITVGSSSRSYNLKLPANYDQNHPYRLIISYHWLGGTAANVSTGSGGTIKPWYDLDTAAASNGTTVFVAPEGISNGWSNTGGADVTFSRTLITQLESTICIDKARIFCEGFSMGGSMSYAMASAAPEIIRAVAVHSGGAMSGTTSGHNKPVAYFMTHGTKDSVCKWTEQYGWPQLEDFAKVNGCKSPDPTLAEAAFKAALPQPTSTAGVCLDFTGCTAGYPTRSCLFVGDHTPSPDGQDGWVPKETWKFFSQF